MSVGTAIEQHSDTLCERIILSAIQLRQLFFSNLMGQLTSLVMYIHNDGINGLYITIDKEIT